MSSAQSRSFCRHLNLLKAFRLTNNVSILTNWGLDKIADMFRGHIHSLLWDPIGNMTTSIGSGIGDKLISEQMMA